jgi:magnesium-transporting ATPase (P-type)
MAPSLTQTLPIEQQSAEAAYALMGSRPSGLTTQEAAELLGRFGPNTITEAKRVPLVRRLVSHFTHLMAILLWAGGGMAFLAGLSELGIVIWLVNVINGIFSFWQEFRAEKATEALRRLLPVQARVLRDGAEARIPADGLVPGDILLLEEGDLISADGRVVEHAELRVNQSTLTGEANPVRKTVDPVDAPSASPFEMPNLVFAGTTVTAGRGKAVAVSTGMSTEFGKIASLTQAMKVEQSPLQKELARLSYVVSVVAIGVGVVFFVSALALGAMDLGRGLVFALGMIVAFVPEGLLPTVTLALAMGTQRMAKRNALVKRLSAVETLGSTSVICTDKTGTLTKNEMTVREVVLPDQHFELTGVGYATQGEVRDATGHPWTLVDGDLAGLFRSAGLNCNARVAEGDDGRTTVIGDPTEAAIMVACRKAGLDLEAEAVAYPRVAELPFDSVRKRVSTVHATENQQVVFTKGAPRELLGRCSYVRIAGTDVSLTGEVRAALEAANDDMSRRGLRVLAVTHRVLPIGVPADGEAVEQELTFLGLIGMMDPPRPEVEAAVATCRRAGIRIVMITGDYGLTGESVGRRVGMIAGRDVRIINGAELETMSDESLAAALGGEEVLFARATPEHKMRVVSSLQELGHVVAVTGDGVNDAPALKKADIGVAMGLSGTDVAREAADMILLDDNFASIVNAVEEGRAVYANIRRFTSYIFTSNTPEAVPFIFFAFSAGRIPLALDVMAILAIDLGTDLVPALALGAEKPEAGVMDRPPRKPSEHIVNRHVLARAYFWLGPLQSAAVMGVFFLMYWTNGYPGQFLDLPVGGNLQRSAVAIALAAVVATQIGNLFAQRAERNSILRVGFFSNRLVWVGITSELAIIALIVYVPFLQRLIGTGSFPPGDWLWLIPLVPLLLIADEFRKWLVRWRERRSPS